MRVFVAGAGGALGSHVVCRLIADGHEVIGFTRSSAHGELVRKLGASRVITGDALSASNVAVRIAQKQPALVPEGWMIGKCTLQVGMLCYPRLTQLDLTGPYEVLSRMPETRPTPFGKRPCQ